VRGLSPPRVRAERDTWSLASALGQIVFQRTVTQWLAVGAFEPDNILSVLHALQEFFIGFDGDDHRYGFANANTRTLRPDKCLVVPSLSPALRPGFPRNTDKFWEGFVLPNEP
jgi:hypothetical protein